MAKRKGIGQQVEDAIGGSNTPTLFQPGELSSAATLRPTGVEFHLELSFEEWQAGLAQLREFNGALSWWWGDWVRYAEQQEWGEKYTQALEASDMSYGGLRNAAWVADRIPLSRRRDKLSYSHHQEVAPLEPEEQNELLDAAELGNWTRSELRKAVREYRKQTNTPKAPPDTYRIIYADPPWAYNDARETGWGGAASQYPTLSVEEIVALNGNDRPISEWAWPKKNGAVLFLWATVPQFPEALEVVNGWGFEYKTHIVWHKPRPFVGHYTAVEHELLILATRGSCVPDVKDRPPSVMRVDVERQHSKKPPEFRQLIDQLYPEGPAIELFARGFNPSEWTPKRWSVWGNEA